MVRVVDIRLDNGTAVVLRPIRPEDKALIADGVAHLSSESAYRRFLAPRHALTPAELRYFTEVDFRDHVALVAVPDDDPDTLLGVGRWVRSREDAELAEVAYLVADEAQGQGLGTALVRALADSARRHGVRRFVATMLPSNGPARRLFTRVTRNVRTRMADGIQELEGRLAA